MTASQNPEERFQDFLRSFAIDGDYKYRKRLGHVALSASRSLVVDFEDLIAFDPELARYILDKPDEYMEYLDRSAWAQLKIEDPEYAEIIKRLRVRFRKLPEKQSLRIIGSENIGRMLCIDGIIVRSTSVKPLLIKAAFQCRKCNAMTYVEQAGVLMRGPGVCPHCRSRIFEFMEKQSTFMNSQEIRIQERPEDLPPGQLPRAMDIKLSEDLVDIARPGDRVSITGVARAQQEYMGRKARLRTFDLLLDANYVDIVGKEVEVVEITPEDERQIRELAKDPFIHRKLIASLAPSIYGYGDIKEAVLYLLFGGVPKRLPDGVTIRSEVNVLLVGDPGTAKSQLLQYVSRIAPRGLYTSGRGTSIDAGEPLIVRMGGQVRVMRIGDLVDPYYQDRESGFVVPVSNIECLSYDSREHRIKWSKVSHVYRHSNNKPLLRVKLQTGREITVTDDHSLFSFYDGALKPIETSVLKRGDFLAIPGKAPRNHEIAEQMKPAMRHVSLNLPLARLLGYYVAEGYLHENPSRQSYRIHFELNKKERHIARQIDRCSRRLFGVGSTIRMKPSCEGMTVTISGKQPFLFFRDILKVSRGAKQKRIPDVIFGLPAKTQKEFLEAYLEGDRGVTASKYLISDLLYLAMQSMQVVGKFSTRKPSLGFIQGRKIAGGPHYQLKAPSPYNLKRPVKSLTPPLREAMPILQDLLRSPKEGSTFSGAGYERITERIIRTMVSGRRAKRLQRLRSLKLNCWTEATQFASQHNLDSRLARAYLQRCNHDGLVQRKYNHGRLQVALTEKGRNTISKISELGNLIHSDLQFAKILTVEKAQASSPFIYDLSVPENENFIAGFGGILCHNTAAGLTAAVVREKSGGMVLEAGALVLADKGIACMTGDTEVYVGDRVVSVGRLWDEGGRCKILASGQEVKPLFCAVTSYFGEERIDVKSYTRKIVRRQFDGKVLRITFASGLSIKLTPEHLVRSNRSSKRLWVQAKELHVGDIVKAPAQLFPPPISFSVGEKTAYTLGFIYGDGYVTAEGVTIAQSRNNESIIANVQQLSPFPLSRYDSGDKVKTIGGYVLVERLSRLWTGNRELRELYHSTIGRSLDAILQFPTNELAAFLAGLLDNDGNLNFTKGSLTCVRLFPTANEHHLSVLIHSLRKLGVRASIRRTKSSPNVHTIQISGTSMTRFLKLICPWSEKAKSAMDKPVRHKMPRLQLDEEEVARIEEVEYKGYVYDLCVRDFHNFVAEGIYIHNCIDEIDKMRPEDRVAIHESLEQHTVSVAKGGIVATLNARAAVLAAANPSLGRYDPYRNITDNINLPVTLLTRFDLLFIMKDIPEPDSDTRMSDHILTLHRMKTTPEEPPMLPELLRKYIAFAKRIEPALTEDSVNAIRQYYLKMRSLSGSAESPVAITPRQLEALVRLAEARARSFLRDRVEAEDAQAIIRLMTLSLQDVGIDTTTGKIDIDVIMTGKPKSLRDKMQEVLSTFAELERQLGIVEDSTLYQALTRKPDISEDDARRLVDQLVKEGILYSPKPGHLKRTAA